MARPTPPPPSPGLQGHPATFLEFQQGRDVLLPGLSWVRPHIARVLQGRKEIRAAGSAVRVLSGELIWIPGTLLVDVQNLPSAGLYRTEVLSLAPEWFTHLPVTPLATPDLVPRLLPPGDPPIRGAWERVVEACKDLAFTLTCGLSHGARGGLAVALGTILSDLLLTTLTTLGITATILAWPPSFDLLRWLGALYLVGLAVQALRRRGLASVAGNDRAPLAQILRMALLNSLLNPKALLFFLVFLPQFVSPGQGSLQVQLATLGITLSLIALAFHAGLGVTSGKLASWFQQGARSGRRLSWIHAGLFLALAARLVLLARPTSG